MPLLSTRRYLKDGKDRKLVDETDPYDLQNYDIHDDDEITSSDEGDIDGFDDESGEGSYYASSRPGTANIGSITAQSDEKSKRPRSVSPFKRSFSSLFKRHESNVVAEHRETEESKAYRSPSPVTETEEESHHETTNSSKFWRSWRSRQHKHNPDPVETVPSLFVTKTAPTDHTELELSRRRSNVEKLAELQLDDSPQKNIHGISTGQAESGCNSRAPGKSLSSKEPSSVFEKHSTIDSSESESSEGVQDAMNPMLPESGGQRRSEPPHLASPLTPVDEFVSWKKSTSGLEVEQYRSIYQTPKDYVALEDQFDSLEVNKNSKTYLNFLNTIELLDGSSHDLSKNHTLVEFSSTALVLAKNKLETVANAREKEVVEIADVNRNTEVSSNASKNEDSKSLQIKALEAELSSLRDKYDSSLEDLYDCRKELKTTKLELADAREAMNETITDINQLKLTFDDQKRSWTNTEEELRDKLKTMIETTEQEHLKFGELKSHLKDIETDHETLVGEHNVLKKQHEAGKERMNELVRVVSENETETMKVSEANMKLQRDLEQKTSLAAHAKSANVKLQKDYQRERCKLLDARRELDVLRAQIDVVSCHKTESLQFMAQMMMSFRDVLSKDTLQQCDAFLEAINSNRLFNNALFDTQGKISKQCLNDQMAKEFEQVTQFYRQFAKERLLDQLFAKHVSYMRSNSFLSQQLKGLRQEAQNHEEYISRLLKDCKTQKIVIAKLDAKIQNLKKC